MSRPNAWFAALAIALLGAACSGGSKDAAPTATSTGAPTATTAAPASTSAVSTAATSAPGTSTTAPAAATTAPVPPARAYAEAGPYPVGTTTLQLGDRPVTVWYPAVPGSEVGAAKATYDLRTFLPAAEQPKVAALTSAVFTMDAYEGLPAAPGPFPIVLFSHGFAGFRYQSTFLTTALASWGFVVAAPDHLARNLTAVLEGRVATGQTDIDDLKQTAALLSALSADPASPLAGRIDATKVAAVGHSAGGGAAFQLAGDPANGIDAVVGLAPAISPEQPVLTAAIPSLAIAGTADALIPVDRVRQAWATGISSPKRLVELAEVTHLGFTEICLLTPEQGGVLQAAKNAGVAVPDLIARLFADGCDAKYAAAADAFPVIRHATIAQVRAALGVDPAPVGLDDSLATAFPPIGITTQAG